MLVVKLPFKEIKIDVYKRQVCVRLFCKRRDAFTGREVIWLAKFHDVSRSVKSESVIFCCRLSLLKNWRGSD